MEFKTWDALWNYITPYLHRIWLPLIEVGLGILIGPRVKHWIMRLSEKSIDKGTMTFFGSAANVAIIAISVIIALEQLGVKLNNIMTLLSAVGLGLSLALKGNMANVAGGIQILVTKPFSVGDYIKINDHKGVVTAVELMFTTIRTDNSKVVVIPNSTLVSGILTNYSREPLRRLTITFPIKVPVDVPTVKKQALEIAGQNEDLAKDPAPSITVRSFAEGYVNFVLIGYVSAEKYERCHYMVNEQLASHLKYYKPDEGESS